MISGFLEASCTWRVGGLGRGISARSRVRVAVMAFFNSINTLVTKSPDPLSSGVPVAQSVKGIR